MNLLCRIELFGGLQIVRGGRVISRFDRKKTATLLAYLAYFNNTKHFRESLIDLLWPECESIAAGRDRLSTALSPLRHLLEPIGIQPGSIIEIEEDTISLNAQLIQTDVRDFEDSIKRAYRSNSPAEKALFLARAVEFYRNGFLPGLYDDWAISEQQRLSLEFINALMELSNARRLCGEFQEALKITQRVINLDRHHEPAYVMGMKLHSMLGNNGAMKKLFIALESNLRKDLQLEPKESTRELVSILSTAKESNLANSSLVLNSLPPRRNRFVGRDIEIAKLKYLFVTEQRLVTLIGPGGVGKSRLAFEFCEHMATRFDCHICLAPLSNIDSPDFIVYEIAKSLNLIASDDSAMLKQIVKHLSSRPCILVFDNFEHLLEFDTENSHGNAACRLVSQLLDNIPTLRILVTSRRALLLQNEQWFPVMPLPVPGETKVFDDIEACPSVELYAQRARMVNPNFQITKENVEYIARICELLEGMPLYIELAAAQAGTYTPVQSLLRLEPLVDSLVSIYHDVPSRHKSARDTYASSLRKLKFEERSFLGCLSVFRGGWTLELAEAVTESKDTGRLLHLFNSDSLILRYEDSVGEGVRFRMLEPIRELAQEMLSLEEKNRIALKFVCCFLDLAERAKAHMGSPSAEIWLKKLHKEHTNLRFSFDLALDLGENAIASRICIALFEFYRNYGYLKEGRSQYEKILAVHETIPLNLTGDISHCDGTLAMLQGDYAYASDQLHKSLKIRDELEDKRGSGLVLNSIGILERRRGNGTEARAYLNQALIIFKEIGDHAGIRSCLSNLGNVARDLCEYQVAYQFHVESLDMERKIGDEIGIAASLNNLAMACRALGNYDEALKRYKECLSINRKLENKMEIATALTNTGNIHEELGDYASAQLLHEAALKQFEEIDAQNGIHVTLNNLGNVMRREGKLEEARNYFERSLGGRKESGDKLGASIVLGNLGQLTCATGNHRASFLYFTECLSLSNEIRDWEGVIVAVEGFVSLAVTKSQFSLAQLLVSQAGMLRKQYSIPRPKREEKAWEAEIEKINAHPGFESNNQIDHHNSMSFEELTSMIDTNLPHLNSSDD